MGISCNHLANFLFVLLNMESMNEERGKIMTISAAMYYSYHWMNTGIFPKGNKEVSTDTETIAHGGENGETDEEKHNEGMRRYAVSKLLLVMFICVLSFCPTAEFPNIPRYQLKTPSKQRPGPTPSLWHISRSRRHGRCGIDETWILCQQILVWVCDAECSEYWQ